MNIFELQTIAKLNRNLPDNAYFSYKCEEIIEFNSLYTTSIELKNGKIVPIVDIDIDDIRILFDKSSYR